MCEGRLHPGGWGTVPTSEKRVAANRQNARKSTGLYARVLTSQLPYLDPILPDTVAAASPVARAWRDHDAAIGDLVTRSTIAA